MFKLDSMFILSNFSLKDCNLAKMVASLTAYKDIVATKLTPLYMAFFAFQVSTMEPKGGGLDLLIANSLEKNALRKTIFLL